VSEQKDKEELNPMGKKAFNEVLEVLDELFQHCDEDCPGEYRSEHLRSALSDALDVLVKHDIRIRT